MILSVGELKLLERLGGRAQLRENTASGTGHHRYVAQEEPSKGQSAAYLGNVTAWMKGTF